MPGYRAPQPPPPPAAVRLGGIVRYDKMPPRGIRRYFWRWGITCDSHLCSAMLEWWEALIIGILVLPITVLFWYSAWTYFPAHFRYMSKRFSYYVFGDDKVDILACTRVYVAEWLNIAWLWIQGLLHPATSPKIDL